ncbi:MAG TPA: DNA alkylation repair protein [Dissulfurispiraceae bacterium]|nr:DNA alkylation repair protein [Dissulfurispiraceae bacterium]
MMDALADINRHIAVFRKTLKQNSNPERAAKEKSYLKSPHKFFGVTVPFIARMAKDFKRTHGDLDKGFVFELGKKLWDSEYHQEKTLAIKILEQYGEYLDFESMPMLELMLSSSSGWDHVDSIANHLVDAVLRKDRRTYEYLKRWSRSENFWMRRAALISQVLLFREGKGDRKLFFSFAEKMIEEKEFFIRKAIGWVLRDMSKAEPDAVYDFLMNVKDRASALTLREGSKRLPEDRQKFLLKNTKRS